MKYCMHVVDIFLLFSSILHCVALFHASPFFLLTPTMLSFLVSIPFCTLLTSHACMHAFNACIPTCIQNHIHVYTPCVVHTVSCVLLAHVTPGAIASTDILESGTTTVESLLTDFDLVLAAVNGTVTVNDVPVTVGDVNATNGIVHSIAQVLLPDCVTQDLYAVLSSNPLFATLVTLVASANLTEALSAPPTENGLTILAPSMEAFAKVPADVLAYLGSNPAALMQVISYHILPQNYDGSILGELETLLDGETIEVSIVENGDGTLVLNDGAATVTRANILASNGIVHEIDSVLLPESFNMSQVVEPEEPVEPVANATEPTDTNTPEATPEPITNMTTTAPVDTNMTAAPVDTNMTNATMAPGGAPLASLLDVVSNSAAHTTLAAAVGAMTADATDGSSSTNAIADLLADETKTLTVFAPDEDAFSTLAGDGTLERLLTEPWKGHCK